MVCRNGMDWISFKDLDLEGFEILLHVWFVGFGMDLNSIIYKKKSLKNYKKLLK